MKAGTLIAIVLAVVLFGLGIWWLTTYPKDTVVEVGICPTAREFTKVLPPELPAVDDNVNMKIFCGFSYEQGFVTLKTGDAWVEIILVGTTEGVTLRGREKKVAPIFHKVDGVMLSGEKLALFYTPDEVSVFLGGVLWAMCCIAIEKKISSFTT